MKRKTLMGLLFILAGIVIFTARINEFNVSTLLHRYWPVVIILIGVLILFSGEGKGIKLKHDDRGDEYVDYMNVFSGLTTVNESKNFKGGAITAIFGSAEVDLRPASISPDGCEISITTIFGGAELRLPENCNLVVSGIPIFGGWENKKLPTNNPELPLVKIKCFVAFGGIDIS